MFLGTVFLVIGLFWLFALADYSPAQTGLDTAQYEENKMGEFGLRLARHSMTELGAGAYSVPLGLLWISYMYFFAHAHRLRLPRVLSLLGLVFTSSVLASLAQLELPGLLSLVGDEKMLPHGLGGRLGYIVFDRFLVLFIGKMGTLLVFGVLATFSLFMLLLDNLFMDVWRMARGISNLLLHIGEQLQESKPTAQKAKASAESGKAGTAKKESPAATSDTGSGSDKTADKSTRKRGLFAFLFGSSPKKQKTKVKKERKPAPAALRTPRRPTPVPFRPLPENEPELGSGAPTKKLSGSVSSSGLQSGKRRTRAPVSGEDTSEAKEARSASPDSASSEVGELRVIAGEKVRKAKLSQPASTGKYRFPPVELLHEAPDRPSEDSEEVHRETAALLVRTLDEFGVKVRIGDVHSGPVITRYDIYPAPGVRVERIVSLDKNIALGLKALSVRILAPVPGKGCVGIEVPNRNPQSVFLRDILETETWNTAKAEIPIALGKDVSGRPLIADLSRMPHLLIAGATGSGKTVCINAVITSLIFRFSPDDLRLVMVDPKIVEMQVYNALPHMMIPVVTEPKKVPNALRFLLSEMERRYQIFAKANVRNIAAFNARMTKSKAERKAAEEAAREMDASLTPEERAASAKAIEELDFFDDEVAEKLPYIVCIVDELADLMMVAPAEIETGIARLAQLARAAGIHLILATQRPSVNVITGVIKANLPSRIAFKVASKVDSRTILDSMGADQLIGRGDLLFLPPGSADLVRAQGAFVSDDEINNLIEFMKSENGEPQFDEQFQQGMEEDTEGDAEETGKWEDELVPDAIEVIRTSKRASTSMLQRRLKIGYNRAARIMDILEDEGYVGPENGSSPREILRDMG